MKYFIACVLSLVTVNDFAEDAPKLEIVLVDKQRFYGKGDELIIDVYLHTTKDLIESILFCSRGDHLGIGDFKLSSQLSPWKTDFCVHQGPAGVDFWDVSIHGDFLCGAQVVPIPPGRVHLGSMKGVVVDDAKPAQASSIRVGDCSDAPSQASFEQGGSLVDVEQAEPVIVLIQRHPFIRGDANYNGIVDISDAIHILAILFRVGGDFLCPNAADANDDNVTDMSDAVYLLSYLFLGTLAPPVPYPEAGYDRNSTLPENSGCAGL